RLLEVAVGRVEPSPVGTHHPQVVIRDRAPLLVAGAPVRLERAFVAGDGFAQLALDVGENSEVLLDARAQLPARAAELEGLEKGASGVLDRAGGEMEAAQGIERFRRE